MSLRLDQVELFALRGLLLIQKLIKLRDQSRISTGILPSGDQVAKFLQALRGFIFRHSRQPFLSRRS